MAAAHTHPPLHSTRPPRNLHETSTRPPGDRRVAPRRRCAAFGAGVYSACVVDLGAQRSSVCCVDEGMPMPGCRQVPAALLPCCPAALLLRLLRGRRHAHAGLPPGAQPPRNRHATAVQQCRAAGMQPPCNRNAVHLKWTKAYYAARLATAA